MEEKEEEVRGKPIGYCYQKKDCTGTKCSNSKVEERVCKNLGYCKSWKNSETGKCVNF
jgi:hypothetical protein